MSFSKRIYTSVLFFLLFAVSAGAQDRPVGYWESHLPYDNAVGVATDGVTLYTICYQGFFTWNSSSAQSQAYSKVEGMSDIGMQCIAYDAYTGACILVYTDGNIDIFKNNTFYNIPDLKIKAVSGTKSVYSAYAQNGIAYLSTSLGIILVDMQNHDILETYQFISGGSTIPVTSFTGFGDYFYAATPTGLFRASQSSPDLQNFAVWQNIDSAENLSDLCVVKDVLFISTPTEVYAYTGDTVTKVYASPTSITNISGGYNDLYIAEKYNAFNGKVKIMDLNYNIGDSFVANGNIYQSVQLMDSSIWTANYYFGLQKRTGPNSVYLYFPPGPGDAKSFGLYAHNRDLWIAHGGYADNFGILGNGDDLSHLDNKDNWQLLHQYGYTPFDTMQDFVTVLKDQTTGTLYAGSFQDGLFILNNDGTFAIVKQNSILDSSISYFGQGQRQVIGTALDHDDNLWVTELYSAHQLYVKTKDSAWYKFQVPPASSYGGPIAIDNNNQVWFVCAAGNLPGNTGGVTVYNTNGTLSDPTDDTYYHLQQGVGLGNLPSNNTLSIACDLNNNIWIGTDNGIGIVSGCAAPFTQQSPPCDAQLPIVQYDQFAGYLFAGFNVRVITVDGANRKWIGTDDGVWLLSPDASQIVYYFNTDNSPLPSNTIEAIAIDDVTGDVYIGTDQGLVCYHGTATTGGKTNQNVVVYPDPVPDGYAGTIAIKGLVADADVRITDINGQLVYRTTALGGQAVWNGLDYKGHRPQSGVYLIFASSSDGSHTYAGKMVFMK